MPLSETDQPVLLEVRKNFGGRTEVRIVNLSLMSRALLRLISFSLAACASDPEPGSDSPLPPPAEGEGFQLSFEVEVPAGEEAWKCEISELPTVGFFPVNRAESVQSAGMHHMDILALEFTGLELENGVYDCADLYAEHAELMENGIFLYASQMPEQTLQSAFALPLT